MPSDPHTVLMCFDAAHRAHRDGWPAPLVKGKDHRLAADLLEQFSMPQLTALVEHFFIIEDDFIAKAGYGFGIFKACLPKVLADYQRHRKTDAQARMLRERQQRDVESIAEWRSLTIEQRAKKLAEG